MSVQRVANISCVVNLAKRLQCSGNVNMTNRSGLLELEQDQQVASGTRNGKSSAMIWALLVASQGSGLFARSLKVIKNGREQSMRICHASLPPLHCHMIATQRRPGMWANKRGAVLCRARVVQQPRKQTLIIATRRKAGMQASEHGVVL